MRLVFRILPSLAIVALLVVSPAAAAPFALLQTLHDPTPAAADFFGYPIVPLGGDILVGAGEDDTAADDAGAVYLFEGDPTSPAFGTLLHTFTKPSAADDDYFGNAVAVVGTNVVISSVRDDTAGPDAGAAYLFDGDQSSPTFGSVLQTFLNPTPAVDDYFGYALVGVGGNVAVSDYRDNASGAEAGAVYLFDAATGTLLHTFLPPQNGEHRFGYALAAIGSQLIVGAPHAPPPAWGAVYVYDADPASPTFGALLRTITNPQATATEFGESLAIIGDTIVIGAPFESWTLGGTQYSGGAYLFDGTTGALLQTFLTQVPIDNGQFGYAVASLGTLAVIGAPHEDLLGPNSGGAYVFDADPASPSFGGMLQRLDLPPSNPAGDGLGLAVAAVGAGVVLGAPSASGGGQAHVFTRCGDGIVTANEECDDGNLVDRDCCSSSCRIELGLGCDDGDGDACTTGICVGAGVCVAQGAVPESGCAAPTPKKARLRIGGGKLEWKWRSGTSSPLAYFGDPASTTDYTLCVYDHDGGTLALRAAAPAAGTCAGKPCWRAKPMKGFRYKDADRTPDGVAQLVLETGYGFKTELTLKAGGPNLATPALPMVGAVTAQLKASNGVCWSAEYGAPQRNDATVFKAASN